MEMPLNISSMPTTSSCNRRSCALRYFKSFFFFAQDVVVACGSHIHNFHAGFYPGFQIDVSVHRYILPEIDLLNTGVFAADTVNLSKPLDDAHSISLVTLDLNVTF